MAINVTLSGAEMVIAADAGVLRQVSAIRDRRSDFYRDDGGGQNKWQAHILGCLGEFALAKHLDIFWSGTVGQVHLPDVGPFEVRTRAPSRFGNDLTLTQRDHTHRKYILVVSTPPVFILHGWIYGREGVVPKYKHPGPVRGETLFYVPPSDLRPLNTLMNSG
tara:strand:+ start:500 stop:988 length:489 start_codon:yes stop_codon:yes gene_type:complete